MPIRLTTKDYFSHPALPVAVFRRECGIATVPHQHDFHEVMLVLGGSATHVQEGKAQDFAAGDVLRVRAGQVHHFRRVRRLRLLHVLLLSQAIGQHDEWFPQGGTALLRPVTADFQRLKMMMEELEWLLSSPRPHASDVRVNVDALLAYLIACWKNRGVDDCPPVQEIEGFHEAEQRLGMALRHLEEHFDAQTPKVAELARMSGMSERTLLREFRKVTGRTPVAYLHGLRLHHAMVRLRDSQKPVTDVAYGVGFNDLSFFNHKFKALTGQPPTRWRNRPGHEW